MSHDKGCLLTLNQSDGCSWSFMKKVLAKQALYQMEIRYLQFRVRPGNLTLRFLYPMASLAVIAHQLACPYITIGINLPEDSTSSPFVPCSYKIQAEDTLNLIFADNTTEVLVERVLCLVC